LALITQGTYLIGWQCVALYKSVWIDCSIDSSCAMRVLQSICRHYTEFSVYLCCRSWL